MKAVENKDTSGKKKWAIFFAVIFCFIIVAFVVTRLKETVFPSELIGLWHTDDQRYVDRYFSINESSIIIGQGEDRQALYYIDNVEKENIGEYTLFKLKCTDEENNDDYFFQIQYKAADGGVNFVNINNVIWAKAKKE